MKRFFALLLIILTLVGTGAHAELVTGGTGGGGGAGGTVTSVGTNNGLTGGTITTTGTLGLASVATNSALCNNTGSSNPPTAANCTVTGTGNLVLATSPSLITPSLGVATATSLNSLTITTSTGTLTIANGKTLTDSNTLTLTGTDGSSVNFGTGGTVLYGNQTITLTGDTTGTGTTSIATTTGKVDGVTYPSGPSANTVPVVTSATSGGTVTYEAVPNAALANSAITFGATSQALGSTVTNLNAVNVGPTTAGTGAFTTLSASSTVSGTGFSNYLASPPAIGGTAPAAGNFTTLSGSSTITFSGISGSTQCLHANSSGVVTGTGSDCGSGGGGVTATGSPASGNLTKWSGSNTITNGDLSGDITTSGTLATTLATVNSNVGSFTNANITVNGKGLVTAAANGGAAGITLGTSAAATNPQRSGQGDTGLYSATSAHVSVAVDVSGTGTQVADFLSTGLNLPTGETYQINGSQIACSNLSNGATGCSTATGTSGSTLPLNNGNNTLSGNDTHSGTVLFTGGIPALANGNAAVAASSTLGGIFTGQGSVDDVIFENKSGGSVCAIATGTTNLNCTGLQVGGTSVLTGNQTITLSGDTTGSGTTAITTSTVKVNGGSIPASATALASNSSNQIIAATLQGNGAKVQLSTGTTTTNDCVKFDANGNTIDAGAACGSGGSVPGYVTQAAIATERAQQMGSLNLPDQETYSGQIGRVRKPNLWLAGQAVTPSTIPISTATFTPNFVSSNNFNVSLVHAACPCTLANPTNVRVGQSGIIAIQQSATGSDTITSYGSSYVFTNATSPALSTTANAIDYISYYVESATVIRMAYLPSTSTVSPSTFISAMTSSVAMTSMSGL